MNCEEFSNAFDTLLNSYAQQAAFGDASSRYTIQLDEYEKSVFLTKAQWSVLLGLYRGSLGASFEETEEVTAYLSPLVRQKTITEEYEETGGAARHIISDSHLYQLPEDLLFITFESCELDDSRLECGGSTKRTVAVVPVTQDEFHRTSRNPFRGASAAKVLRLSFGDFVSDALGRPRFSELVSKYTIGSYTVRYVKRPRPIVTAELPDGLSVDGYSSPTGCEINPAAHSLILEEAVRQAVASKSLQYSDQKRK